MALANTATSYLGPQIQRTGYYASVDAQAKKMEMLPCTLKVGHAR